jgi:UDP:flavonoid glycosyltransferase YjiC (YdhE family)
MARFLFTMLVVNDLGLPTRMVPIARALADRGHDVGVFNPAPAPMQLIEEAGLTGVPMPDLPLPAPVMDIALANRAWDVEEFFAGFYSDADFLRGMTDISLSVIRDFAPDVVVDSFSLPDCLAARILKLPLVTINQGTFHPASRGFKFWEAERPAHLASTVAFVNQIAAEHGAGPFARSADLMAGDLSLIVGTPETDPMESPTPPVAYVGPAVWQKSNAELPAWIDALGREKPLIWLYAGNPRYGGESVGPTPFDSIVVIRAAIEALKDEPVNVVLTAGHQAMPKEIGTLPANFRSVPYLPGLAMAARSDLMIHHGGYSSVMTGLAAGTPAVIIPTATERESNARRMASLGAAEVVMPTSTPDGDKTIDPEEFSTKVKQVLKSPTHRAAARKVAASIHQYGGVREAARRIEEFAASKARPNT